MTKSIMFLLLIVAICSLICSVLANLIRAAELRKLQSELRRYERAFRSVKVVTKYIEKERPAPEAEIKVVNDTKRDDLPKFGDE